MALLSPRGRTVLTGMVMVQRLVEVAHSSRNLRRTAPGVRAAPRIFPLIVLVNVGGGVACLRAAQRRRDPPAALEAAALTGLAGATALRLWVIAVLGPSWNIQAQVSEQMTVVTQGPYRWVRHPNYVALAIEFLCLPLAMGAYTEAVVFSAANSALLLLRIRAEEVLLDAVPGYREAFSQVPRFLPRRGGRRRLQPARFAPQWPHAGEPSLAHHSQPGSKRPVKLSVRSVAEMPLPGAIRSSAPVTIVRFASRDICLSSE